MYRSLAAVVIVTVSTASPCLAQPRDPVAPADLRCKAVEPEAKVLDVPLDPVATALNPANKAAIFPYAVHNLAFAPDGRLLAGGNGYGHLLLWDVKTGGRVHTIKAHENWAFSVAWSSDGQSVLTGGGDDLVHLWRTKDLPRGPAATFRGHRADVHAVAFHPRKPRWAASAGDDRKAIIWDVETGQVVHTLEAHERQIPGLAVSPDGRILATASRSGAVRLWTTDTGELLRDLVGHERDVMSVRFSPDGRHLASGSYDSTIRRWNVGTGEQLMSAKAHSGAVVSIDYSPDGSTIAAVDDREIVLLDSNDGSTRARWQLPFAAFAQNSWVTFTPDGKQLAVATTTGRVYLLAADNGRFVRVFAGPLHEPAERMP